MTKEQVAAILCECGKSAPLIGCTWKDELEYWDNEIVATFDARKLASWRRMQVLHGPRPKWMDNRDGQLVSLMVGATVIANSEFQASRQFPPAREFADLDARLRRGMTGPELDRALAIRPDVIVETKRVGYQRFYRSLAICLTSDEFDELQTYRRVWPQEPLDDVILEKVHFFRPDDYYDAAARLKFGMSMDQVEKRLDSKPDVVTNLGPNGTVCMWSALSCSLTFGPQGLVSWQRATPEQR
jgi:hypothetical protein